MVVQVARFCRSACVTSFLLVIGSACHVKTWWLDSWFDGCSIDRVMISWLEFLTVALVWVSVYWSVNLSALRLVEDKSKALHLYFFSSYPSESDAIFFHSYLIQRSPNNFLLWLPQYVYMIRLISVDSRTYSESTVNLNACKSNHACILRAKIEEKDIDLSE